MDVLERFITLKSVQVLFLAVATILWFYLLREVRNRQQFETPYKNLCILYFWPTPPYQKELYVVGTHLENNNREVYYNWLSGLYPNEND